ncbi:MAG: ABC transporter ATP-binding protein [Deltaproteobacteria bacterium]|jgi:putative spermidine/putrescine transport system ATP-binding protein|nr:ABC transporter ATP-binding protein [Deltaproteobacteria bacterium]
MNQNPGASAPESGCLVDFEPVPIRLCQAAKSFGRHRVVHPFSLEIPAGKKVALLGPSGCGKTTTLRLIAGLESPDPGGRIFLGDRDVTDVPVEKRRIGMVFQHFALFPHMTVEENVAYGLAARKSPKAGRAAVVSQMLSLVKLGDRAKRRIDGLSGGEKQRVALARALASGPRVLLLDEPLAALDAILRVSLREELDELLSQLGVTTVMVTHDQDEAMALGDMIVVMKDGRVEQSGSPHEIYHHPKTPFVAGFMGGSNHLIGNLDGDFLRLPGAADIPVAALRKNGDGRPGDGHGGKVSVYFRPDKPSLAPVAPGRMRGTLVSKRFIGQKTRLVVRLAGGASIKLELAGSPHNPGETVGVDLPPEELLLFAPAADCQTRVAP